MPFKNLFDIFKCFSYSDDEETGEMTYQSKRTKYEFPSTLNEFGYQIIDGKVCNVETGGDFEFAVRSGNQEYNQKHYEAFGEVITEEVYKLLESECGLLRLEVPASRDESNTGGGKGFVFASPNWSSNERLLILINGSGVVRAGQWARSLIINQNLDKGTQMPYIKRALQMGFDVMVFNTNQRTALDAEGNIANVKVSGTASHHAAYVWENYVKHSAASHIAIVAHSAGGSVTTDLYSHFKEDFDKRVFAVGFTDSVHMIPSYGDKYNNFIKISCNWASSPLPLDALLTPYRDSKDVLRVSAGVNKHDLTSWNCYESVFKFIHNNLQERTGELIPEVPFGELPEELITTNRKLETQERKTTQNETQKKSRNEKQEKAQNETQKKVQNETQKKSQNKKQEKVQNETQKKAQNETQKKAQNETQKKVQNETLKTTQNKLQKTDQNETQKKAPNEAREIIESVPQKSIVKETLKKFQGETPNSTGNKEDTSKLYPVPVLHLATSRQTGGAIKKRYSSEEKKYETQMPATGKSVKEAVEDNKIPKEKEEINTGKNQSLEELDDEEL